MKSIAILMIVAAALSACGGTSGRHRALAEQIKRDTLMQTIKSMARETVKSGFNAGDGYDEVWIRDYNTFITLATELHPAEMIKENLRVFFRLQGEDGNIVDGFIPKANAHSSEGGYAYVHTPLEPNYAGHKNTVETDQESSLVQAVYRYVVKAGDHAFLRDTVGGQTVAHRLERAMDFLMAQRYNQEYGLLWGATTADWGDVQPEHPWGVYIDENTHYAIDIYDNAMFLIALDNLMELLPETREKWRPIRGEVAGNSMTHLWDTARNKFKPHIYLDGSPFPEDFDEAEVYYHGGTAVAIEAGLLSKEQVKHAFDRMVANMQASGAATIGLTLYPPYPEGSFKNKGMYPYGYQNGGDWDWFGGRMIQQLIRNGFVAEAYDQIQPMLRRAVDHGGFYEWYTVDNQPRGSGTFRGAAGVLYDAIVMFEDFASTDR
ncbi:GH36-type glycosyl hydrolase domain-containing protein [Parapedobacter deserti]|uniref:GH36-type glycosyl hydrolase domain-containing protein n=1 Tax=Parapedobacter deserti TaxID=1912957 RepID=A0ABV7JPP1_9SPHI